MLTDKLKDYIGQQISIESNGANHPTSGRLNEVGDDYVVVVHNLKRVIVALRYIVSILIDERGKTDGEIQSQVYKPKLASPKGRAI
jgi:hypothetical protein